jgi:hypothetical protein
MSAQLGAAGVDLGAMEEAPAEEAVAEDAPAETPAETQQKPRPKADPARLRLVRHEPDMGGGYLRRPNP